jgi:hypothetical protein
MNANELAKGLSQNQIYGDDYGLFNRRIQNMLRQQANRIATLEKQVDALLQHCDDPECWTCGKIICPYGGEMHFHHDGCPTCAQMEYENEQ